MFSVACLLALLALSVTGSPVEVRNSTITLPMTRRLAFSNVTDLLRHDEALIAALTEYSTHDRRDYVHLTSFHFGSTVTVGIGNPTRIYNLIVDSASAITWIGAGTSYVSSAGINTGTPVAVNYGYGSFQGTIFKDSITFGTDVLSIDGMSFGVASTSVGFDFDGVLGIGPMGLTRGTMNPPNAILPTVTDYLFYHHAISQPVVGIFFQPTGTNAVRYGYGEISFGGANPWRHTGILKYIGITTTPRSSRYWGINQRITYAGAEILRNTAGIVHCGCTFLYLASDAYERYKVVTGGTLNPTNGLLQISLSEYNALHTLNFHIGEDTYKLVPNAQIWPRLLNYRLGGGGGDNDIFLIVKGLASPTGSGLDFVNGYVFLQRFYVAFDSIGRRVGFGRTQFTSNDSN
ncbi:family A1 protease [Suillus spraguei]|nr:family A1 protease [Suillus spraguei]